MSKKKEKKKTPISIRNKKKLNTQIYQQEIKNFSYEFLNKYCFVVRIYTNFMQPLQIRNKIFKSYSRTTDLYRTLKTNISIILHF